MTATNKAHDFAYALCEFATEDGTANDFLTILDGVHYNMRDICYVGMSAQITTGAQNGYVAYATEHKDAGMVRSICEFINVDADVELSELGW